MYNGAVNIDASQNSKKISNHTYARSEFNVHESHKANKSVNNYAASIHNGNFNHLDNNDMKYDYEPLYGDNTKDYCDDMDQKLNIQNNISKIKDSNDSDNMIKDSNTDINNCSSINKRNIDNRNMTDEREYKNAAVSSDHRSAMCKLPRINETSIGENFNDNKYSKQSFPHFLQLSNCTDWQYDILSFDFRDMGTPAIEVSVPNRIDYLNLNGITNLDINDCFDNMRIKPFNKVFDTISAFMFEKFIPLHANFVYVSVKLYKGYGLREYFQKNINRCMNLSNEEGVSYDDAINEILVDIKNLNSNINTLEDSITNYLWVLYEKLDIFKSLNYGNFLVQVCAGNVVDNDIIQFIDLMMSAMMAHIVYNGYGYLHYIWKCYHPDRLYIDKITSIGDLFITRPLVCLRRKHMFTKLSRSVAQVKYMWQDLLKRKNIKKSRRTQYDFLNLFKDKLFLENPIYNKNQCVVNEDDANENDANDKNTNEFAYKE